MPEASCFEDMDYSYAGMERKRTGCEVIDGPDSREGTRQKMRFHCTNCGRKLTVPDAKAGKRGRCPKCKEVLTVPDTVPEPKHSPHDRRLLDLPPPEPTETPRETETDTSEAAYHELRGALGGRLIEPEEIPQRRHIWLIDIFLYPLNLSALTILLICVGGPFFLRTVVKFCWVMMTQVQMMLIPWVVSMMIHWAAFIVLVLYLIWYVFQAIRDSARGGIRAPDTGALTPGLAELLGENFKLLITALFCMAPALVYLIYGGGTDAIFWTLYGTGGFIFPMALLAVVIHESLRGLNPLLIVRSVLRTFFHYLVLVPFCYVLCLMFPLAYYFILNRRYWHFSYVLQAPAFYLLLIMAHLLGRFYFKNEEKLYWDT